MLTTILLMAPHPKVQKKVQGEIYAALHDGKQLITLEEQQNMPYMKSMLTEVARWHVVLPLGMMGPALDYLF